MAMRRWLISGAAAAFVIGNTATGVLPASAAAQTTFKIGVDNAAPKGHDWLFVDFFPRASVKVHRGDVLDFSWNKGAIDGLHEVAFLATGGQPLPFATFDGDDGPQLEANPSVFGPSGPPCGTSTTPCDFTGSIRLSSGAQPTALGFDWFVKIDVAPSSNPVNFLCEIHPGMQGSITVVPDAERRSTTDQVEDAAAAQFRADTRGALDAEEDVENHAATRNSDGTRTVNVVAGTATPFVEVVEMLPRRVRINEGDKVKWTTLTIRDVHTVTFPQGHGSDSVDPLLNVCEANPADTPAASPFVCASPADFETHINPQPMGTAVIATTTTVGSSGILATPPAPFPTSFTFSFPNEGRFTYQCRIHDNMIGTVIVKD
jgi:plastocyanin